MLSIEYKKHASSFSNYALVAYLINQVAMDIAHKKDNIALLVLLCVVGHAHVAMAEDGIEQKNAECSKRKKNR